MANVPLVFKQVLFIALGVFCLMLGHADIALMFGILLALVFGNPYLTQTRKAMKILLAVSIVGLGAGMNLVEIAKVGASGFFYTAAGIVFALAIGRILGRIFKTNNELSWLISAGTAICGGSAIAAVAPVVHAKDHQISVALGVVFILNAAALFVFPAIGHLLGMPQAQFGLWSALAIHDTSSVVGAGLKYGPEALQVGTTVKLARALWIVPVALGIRHFYAWQHVREMRKSGGDVSQDRPKVKFPWFIPGFLVMAALATWVPGIERIAGAVAFGAKHLLVLTLFLIGSTLSRAALRDVGAAPFLQGLLLWLIVAGASLGVIYGMQITP